jgi:hypothetical protein
MGPSAGGGACGLFYSQKFTCAWPIFSISFRFKRFSVADDLILYDQIARMPIGDLVPYAKNIRTHSDAQTS